MILLRKIQVYSRININHAQKHQIIGMLYTALLCIKFCQINRFRLSDEIVVFIDFYRSWDFYFHLSRGLRAMHPSRSTRNFDDRLNKTQTPLFKVFL